ncbi:MAG: hypothetical protein ABIQ99_05675 [Thermoflexales bacterium]
MPKSTSGPVLLASILSGLLIGFFAGAYIVYAWAPPELVLQDAPPRSLAFDGVNPQYRDLYVVSIANRYATARDRQRALREAADFLGVTSGDTTVAGAVDMLTSARRIVADENKKGANSRFVAQDEIQLGALASDIERNVKDAPQANALFGRPSEANRLIPRIVGFIILLVLSALAFLIIKLLGNRADRKAAELDALLDGPPGNPSVTVNQFTQAPLESTHGTLIVDDDFEPLAEPAAWNARPAPSAASSTVTIVNPPAPSAAAIPMAVGAAAAGSVVAASSAFTGSAGNPAGTATLASAAMPTQIYAQPPMAGSPAARPLMTFPATTYTYKAPESDNYEEDYQIPGTLGELLGECGASVAERVGDEMPRRVPALGVWAFDKQVFSTTTKVLVTEGAAADPAWRARLAAKGEPVIAREGGVVEIATSALRVDAKVSGLTLDPSGQYFETVTLTFSVQKR